MKDMLCQKDSELFSMLFSLLLLLISLYCNQNLIVNLSSSSLSKMQDIQDYGDGGVSFFPGDRRMRANQNNILNQHQSLKCPRCNSLNTKFCYYNNYNLSQPRHFCKNCRRYWTKGGVLRNVPVGGGCRKTKRSKSKSKSSSTDKALALQNHVIEEKSSTGSHTSSDSSSLTAATVSVSATKKAVEVTDMPNLKLYGNGIEWSTLLGEGFETTPFGIGGNLVNEHDDLKLEGETQFEDRTVQVEFSGRSLDPKMGFEPLDWGSGGGDQILCDLTSSVDHAYWSQSQWTLSDQDQNGLYLP